MDIRLALWDRNVVHRVNRILLGSWFVIGVIGACVSRGPNGRHAHSPSASISASFAGVAANLSSPVIANNTSSAVASASVILPQKMPIDPLLNDSLSSLIDLLHRVTPTSDGAGWALPPFRTDTPWTKVKIEGSTRVIDVEWHGNHISSRWLQMVVDKCLNCMGFGIERVDLFDRAISRVWVSSRWDYAASHHASLSCEYFRERLQTTLFSVSQCGCGHEEPFDETARAAMPEGRPPRGQTGSACDQAEQSWLRLVRSTSFGQVEAVVNFVPGNAALSMTLKGKAWTRFVRTN